METEFADGLLTHRQEACIRQINRYFRLLTQPSPTVVFHPQSLSVYLSAATLAEQSCYSCSGIEMTMSLLLVITSCKLKNKSKII